MPIIWCNITCSNVWNRVAEIHVNRVYKHALSSCGYECSKSTGNRESVEDTYPIILSAIASAYDVLSCNF